jgi:hypothetical protein
MKECNGHKLFVADRIVANIVGMYFCSVCGVKIFIGSENSAYKNTSYDGRTFCFINNGWVDCISCEEMQIKKLLE